MKIRRFIIYSVVYIVLIAALAYSLVKVDRPEETEQYFKFLDVAIFELPLAVWIVAPVAFFALLSIFHITYYGFSNYLFKRAIKRDEGLYKELAKEILLGLDTNKDFKTEFFKVPSQITRILSPWGRYPEVSSNDEDINAAVNVLRNVNSGEIADLKKFKLPKDNPLFIKNEINKIEKMPGYYLDVLKNYKEPNDEISRKANEKLIKIGSFTDVKKFNFETSNDEIMTLIQRFISDEIDLNNEEIFTLLDNFKLSKSDYTQSAILLKNKIAPDALIEIFQKLRAKHQDAEEAYIYVLFELQMLDRAKEILDASEASEYQNLKILMYLREQGKIVPAGLFFK